MINHLEVLKKKKEKNIGRPIILLREIFILAKSLVFHSANLHTSPTVYILVVFVILIHILHGEPNLVRPCCPRYKALKICPVLLM